MPQLDFFTIPHQCLIAALCFFGLYYFNLIFFLPRIWHFYVNKFFSMSALMLNTVINADDYKDLYKDIFSIEKNVSKFLFKKNWRLQKKILFKWIWSFHYNPWGVRMVPTPIKLVLTLSTSTGVQSFLFSFYLVVVMFLKNFLHFNAEKLMLIYFVLLFGVLLLVIRHLLIDFVLKDLEKFILFGIEIENHAEHIFVDVWNYLIILKWFYIDNQISFVLKRIFEIKFLLARNST